MADINVEEVLSKLTLQEKVALLSGIDFWHTKGLPQHGVPSLRTSDGPNGVRGIRFFNGVPAACLPCGTALGATFNQELLEQAGELMGKEAIAKGAHVLLGPTINIQRSPLGGRGFESIGEDPVLAGLGSAAIVRGIQSTGVVATIKHFVCNDQEHERNLYNAIITDRALREIYLMPFMLAVRDAYPKSFMTAYNKVNGTHVSENSKIIKDILRGEWSWKGLIMSDWYGTYSTSESINAGLDLEMPGPVRWRGDIAVHAVRSNKIKRRTIDERARTVLELVKECAKSGIKENQEEGTIDTPETSALLRKIAAESVVLMKNEDQVLPLSKSKSLLVIGPNAQVATYSGGGSASLKPYYAVAPLDAFKGKLSDEKVSFAIGAQSHKQLPLVQHSWHTTTDPSSKKGLTFRAYNEPHTAKERTCVDELVLTESSCMFQDYYCPRLKSELWYADLEGYFTADSDGDYEVGLCVYGTALLYCDDKLVIDNATKQRQGTAFFGAGTEEEKAFVSMKKGQTYHFVIHFGSAETSTLKGADVDFGGGAVRIGGAWKIDPEEEIKKAASLAKSAEQVVICAGLNMDWESEGFDRDNMKLPGHMDAMISAVLEANPKTIIVMQSGTPVEMPWIKQCKGLLHAWYGGNETGNGIADVLFGDINPSAKLSLSWPVKNEDNPAFLNYRSEAGRVLYGEDVYVGYRYYDTVKKEVEFPFGHGLSYTMFSFSDINVKNDGKNLEVSVKVSNTGEKDGAQVVQVYLSQEKPKIRRPAKEMKGFGKVFLTKGQSEVVTVKIQTKYATSYFDEDRGQWIMEAGTYKVIVSDSSAVGKGALEAKIDIEETSWWSGL